MTMSMWNWMPYSYWYPLWYNLNYTNTKLKLLLFRDIRLWFKKWTNSKLKKCTYKIQLGWTREILKLRQNWFLSKQELHLQSQLLLHRHKNKQQIILLLKQTASAYLRKVLFQQEQLIFKQKVAESEWMNFSTTTVKVNNE